MHILDGVICLTLSRGIQEGDGPVARLINRIPAEVVTFYTGSVVAALELREVIGATSLLLFLSFIFILGIILTYVTAKRDPSIDNVQIVLMMLSFFFWSWAVGNPLTLLASPEIVHETLPGLFLLGWSLFMAALPTGSSDGN